MTHPTAGKADTNSAAGMMYYRSAIQRAQAAVSG